MAASFEQRVQRAALAIDMLPIDSAWMNMGGLSSMAAAVRRTSENQLVACLMTDYHLDKARARIMGPPPSDSDDEDAYCQQEIAYNPRVLFGETVPVSYRTTSAKDMARWMMETVQQCCPICQQDFAGQGVSDPSKCGQMCLDCYLELPRKSSEDGCVVCQDQGKQLDGRVVWPCSQCRQLTCWDCLKKQCCNATACGNKCGVCRQEQAFTNNAAIFTSPT